MGSTGDNAVNNVEMTTQHLEYSVNSDDEAVAGGLRGLTRIFQESLLWVKF